jgi:hypothetical protein
VSRMQRWRLVGLGSLMSAGSVFILLLGINNKHDGLLFEIAGVITALFFVPLTLFLFYAAIRLGRR